MGRGRDTAVPVRVSPSIFTPSRKKDASIHGVIDLHHPKACEIGGAVGTLHSLERLDRLGFLVCLQIGKRHDAAWRLPDA